MVFKPIQHVYFNMRLSLPERQDGNIVFERALYPLSVLSANIYSNWILFIPLLNIVQKEIQNLEKDTVETTTISETFGTFNVIVTVIIIGPISILFVFRVHRTLCTSLLSQKYRRVGFCGLFLSQYTMFVVLRYDALKGPVHYTFTGITFLVLYCYHFLTTYASIIGSQWYKLKLICGIWSMTCIFCFLSFIIVWGVDEVQGWPWTATCLCEIIGAILLALLDIVDIYLFRVNTNSWRPIDIWSNQAVLEYWDTLLRCLYYGMAFGLVCFTSWVLWVPFVSFLDPLSLNTGPIATTVSATFSDFNVESTIYLIGPISLLFMFHFYRTAFSTVLSRSWRRSIICALVVIQYCIFIILRYDAIHGVSHIIATVIVFVLGYFYHIVISEKFIKQKKMPFLFGSVVFISFFMAVYIWGPDTCIKNHTRTVEFSGCEWLWTLACFSEAFAIVLLLGMDVLDVLFFCNVWQQEEPCVPQEKMFESIKPRAPRLLRRREDRAKENVDTPRRFVRPRDIVLQIPEKNIASRAQSYRNNNSLLYFEDNGTNTTEYKPETAQYIPVSGNWQNIENAQEQSVASTLDKQSAKYKNIKNHEDRVDPIQYTLDRFPDDNSKRRIINQYTDTYPCVNNTEKGHTAAVSFSNGIGGYSTADKNSGSTGNYSNPQQTTAYFPVFVPGSQNEPVSVNRFWSNVKEIYNNIDGEAGVMT